MSLKTSPKSVTMAVLEDDATNIGSSQSVPSYDVVAQCSRFDQRPTENNCKKRRRMPMRLSLPLHEVFNFRRSRKKSSRKSTKSRSSSEEKIDAPISAEEIEDGTSPSGSQRLFSNDDLKTCAICFNEISFSKFPKLLMCDHRFCSDCLRIYIITEIFDSRVNITCPECPKMMHPNDIRMILNEESLLEKYEIFMLRRHLTCEPDTRWCPATDCNYGVIATGCASCPKLKCERPGCETDFCYHCRQLWHPNKTCDDARVKRTSMILKASNSDDLQTQTTLDTKPCPRCSALIAKMEDGSCNHMTCVICGAEFCWLCMKQISDLHYLSPSGCTFWGKKPWSKKKKVLWQIGTLIGAPLGIALIAGLTVPAMIIGIPIYVGRKLFKRYNAGQVSDLKRNIIVIAGVATSILIAPILAALTVSVGVPILLAYVYGVVPISLCRTGGCGITKTQNGVRLEVDEQLASTGSPVMVRCESVVGGSIGSARSDRKVSLTGQGNSAVPTDDSGWDLRRIGIASEGSDCDSRKSANRKLSILSENTTEDETDRKISSTASAMSKGGISASIVHIERENDCVSNTAIAGESLSGSICGSTGYNPNVKVRKSSFGSDSMNYSLCDNVSNITYPESLAGAIIDTSNGHQQPPPHHAASSSDSTGGNLLVLNQPHASFENSSNSSTNQEITVAASCSSATAGTGAIAVAGGNMKSNSGAGRVCVSNGAAKSNHRHSNRNSSDNNSISIERNSTCGTRSKNSACSTLRVSPISSASAAIAAASPGLHVTSLATTHPKHVACNKNNQSQPKVTLSERSSINVPIAASVVAEVTTVPVDCGGGDDEKQQVPVCENGDRGKSTESNTPHPETHTKNAEQSGSLSSKEKDPNSLQPTFREAISITP